MDTTTTPSTEADENRVHATHGRPDDARRFSRAGHRDNARRDAVRARIVGQVRHLRAQLDELEDSALHKARHAARRTDETVHAHPYGAMGLAAAAGLLIGILATRR